MKTSVARVLALFAAVFFSLSTTAQAAGVELKVEALQEVAVTTAGKTEKKLQPMEHAVPGQEVVYRITYHNTDAKPAERVVIRNPVPPAMSFKAGSAEGAGTQTDVSVDGGKQFGALNKLSVKGADGKPRPATAADVTTVRWTLSAPVAAGAQGVVSYRATLK